MSIPLAWKSYSFPQPLGESVRAAPTTNEKVSALKKLGGRGVGDNVMSESSVRASYFLFASYLSTGVLSHIY